MSRNSEVSSTDSCRIPEVSTECRRIVSELTVRCVELPLEFQRYPIDTRGGDRFAV